MLAKPGVAPEPRGQDMPAQTVAHNYRLGALLAGATALLLSVQEPFSFLAAKRLNSEAFVLVTQVSLLVSVPLLIMRPASRRDFARIFASPKMYPKLAAIFALGIAGLILYKLGLTGAHPIIIAAIFNLSPFWAAMVARVVSGVPIPVAPLAFFGCLAAAFFGAMSVAWSQLGEVKGEMFESFLRGSWVFAIPIPILSALNGTLIGKWFSNYEESAAIAVNFVTPAAVLIPITTYILATSGELNFAQAPAILLMMFGTIIAASVGRVFYQVALTVTGGDNGYVTMFFLAVPALTGLVSLPLSWLIPDLKFQVNPLYLIGLALIAISLLFFTFRSWREERSAETGDKTSRLSV
jgi:drug/metabolite transporter (DMT)-like permease